MIDILKDLRAHLGKGLWLLVILIGYTLDVKQGKLLQKL